MSVDDWQRGFQTGLEQDVLPALRENNRQWLIAAQDIIRRCVAPDMYTYAADLLVQAMQEAEDRVRTMEPRK